MRFLSFLFYSILLCLLLAGETSGQVKFGVKGGGSLTKGNFEGSSTEFALNYHLGVLAHYGFTEKLFLRTELIFSQKGWNIPENDLNKDAKMVLKYINMPILVGMKLKNGVSLFSGPELGYKLYEKRKPAGVFDEMYEMYDFGWVFGANYNITSKLGVDLRYIHGFYALINDNVTITDEFGNIIGNKKFKDGSNRVIQLGIFYTLN